MKFTKLEIAKLLSSTPNVMAEKGEIIQFFHSLQFNPNEVEEGNIIEDYLSFSEQLDKDLLDLKDFSLDKTFLSGSAYTQLKIPKKVQVQLDKEWEVFQDQIKNLDLEQDS